MNKVFFIDKIVKEKFLEFGANPSLFDENVLELLFLAFDSLFEFKDLLFILKNNFFDFYLEFRDCFFELVNFQEGLYLGIIQVPFGLAGEITFVVKLISEHRQPLLSQFVLSKKLILFVFNILNLVLNRSVALLEIPYPLSVLQFEAQILLL